MRPLKAQAVIQRHLMPTSSHKQERMPGDGSSSSRHATTSRPSPAKRARTRATNDDEDGDTMGTSSPSGLESLPAPVLHAIFCAAAAAAAPPSGPAFAPWAVSRCCRAAACGTVADRVSYLVAAAGGSTDAVLVRAARAGQVEVVQHITASGGAHPPSPTGVMRAYLAAIGGPHPGGACPLLLQPWPSAERAAASVLAGGLADVAAALGMAVEPRWRQLVQLPLLDRYSARWLSGAQAAGALRAAAKAGSARVLASLLTWCADGGPAVALEDALHGATAGLLLACVPLLRANSRARQCVQGMALVAAVRAGDHAQQLAVLDCAACTWGGRSMESPEALGDLLPEQEPALLRALDEASRAQPSQSDRLLLLRTLWRRVVLRPEPSVALLQRTQQLLGEEPGAALVAGCITNWGMMPLMWGILTCLRNHGGRVRQAAANLGRLVTADAFFADMALCAGCVHELLPLLGCPDLDLVDTALQAVHELLRCKTERLGAGAARQEIMLHNIVPRLEALRDGMDAALADRAAAVLALLGKVPRDLDDWMAVLVRYQQRRGTAGQLPPADAVDDDPEFGRVRIGKWVRLMHEEAAAALLGAEEEEEDEDDEELGFDEEDDDEDDDDVVDGDGGGQQHEEGAQEEEGAGLCS